MYFSRLAIFSIPALAVASVLPRTDGGDGGNTCNINSSQFCCNNLQSAQSFTQQYGGLLSFFGVSFGNLVGQVGFACNPINVPVAVGGLSAGGSSSGCNQQNVCCQNTQANGLIANNCSPITVNL